MSGDNQKMTKFEIYSNNCLLSVETLFLLLFFGFRILALLFIVDQKEAVQRNLFWWWIKTKRCDQYRLKM